MHRRLPPPPPYLLRAEVILDEKYGLCPQVKPPHSGARYPSLPYWLASRRQRAELATLPVLHEIADTAGTWVERLANGESARI